MTTESSMEDANLTVADVQGLVVSWHKKNVVKLTSCSDIFKALSLRLLCLVQIPPTWQKRNPMVNLASKIGWVCRKHDEFGACWYPCCLKSVTRFRDMFAIP
jgi:hypothetical protein